MSVKPITTEQLYRIKPLVWEQKDGEIVASGCDTYYRILPHSLNHGTRLIVRTLDDMTVKKFPNSQVAKAYAEMEYLGQVSHYLEPVK